MGELGALFAGISLAFVYYTVLMIFVFAIVVLIYAYMQWRISKFTTDTNRVTKAKELIAFGKSREAKEVLEEHLLFHPDDKQAIELLEELNINPPLPK